METLARKAIQRGDNGAGELLARELVARRPIPAEGLSLYANALLANGNDETGASVLQAAAGRGWRDRFVQRIVIISALQQGTPEIAANRVAGLWRLGERGEWLKNLTRITLEAPGGLAAFERTLIDNDAHIATDFLSWGAANLPLTTVKRLAPQISAHHSKFDCVRFSAQTDRLIRNGRINSSMVVWDTFCMSPHREDAGQLRFTSIEAVPGPLDWRYRENPGVDVNLQQDSDDTVLHYASSDPLLKMIASRYLTLEPGRYDFRVGNVASSSGVDLRLNCIARDVIVGMKPELGESGRWSFQVPAECPVQQLSISVRSGIGEIDRIAVSQTGN
ncbi:hypothetical protein [Novosphingobium resinovorum]|uniref:hypothetical protein n=1 Tax=Novosphingobium resinovorum TaxID=158500 RepID=UPI0012DC5075|nr:hypothetical protein [Novosphingobium resinovorum]